MVNVWLSMMWLSVGGCLGIRLSGVITNTFNRSQITAVSCHLSQGSLTFVTPQDSRLIPPYIFPQFIILKAFSPWNTAAISWLFSFPITSLLVYVKGGIVIFFFSKINGCLLFFFKLYIYRYCRKIWDVLRGWRKRTFKYAWKKSRCTGRCLLYECNNNVKRKKKV